MKRWAWLWAVPVVLSVAAAQITSSLDSQGNDSPGNGSPKNGSQTNSPPRSWHEAAPRGGHGLLGARLPVRQDHTKDVVYLVSGCDRHRALLGSRHLYR